VDNQMIFRLAAENAAMGDIDRLVNIYWALSSVLVHDVPGDVVEVGCNVGKTSVFLRMVMDHYGPDRTLHLYDSFQGLPRPGEHDAYLKEGECPATVEQLRETFRTWNLAQPEIHKGWFDRTLPTRLPDRIAFGYLDGDFYESTLTSLEHVYPRLSPNAIIIVDDYCDTEKNERAFDLLPGPKVACDEFFRDKPEKMSVLVGVGDLAFGYIRKGHPARRRREAVGAATASTS
jgi:O-methyltransferase